MSKQNDTESERLPERPNHSATKWRIGLGLLVFGFTLLSHDDQYARWWYLSLFMGTSVLVLQFSRLTLLRVYALWFGLFLVGQSLVSIYLLNQNYVTLLPNQDRSFTVSASRIGIEGVQHLSTDELGFRTTRDINYSEAAPLRIFAIGGSTTEQILLDDKSTFTHLLQEELERSLGFDVEVINTGVSGLRALNHIATLERVVDYHPDMIIILLGVNDWNRHIILNFPDDIPEEVKNGGVVGWQSAIRLRNTLLGQVVLRIQTRTTATAGSADTPLENTDLDGPVGISALPSVGSLDRKDQRRFRPDEVSPEYAHHLSMLLSKCAEQAIPCLMVTQPSAYKADAGVDIERSFWMTPPYAGYTLDLESMIQLAAMYNRHLSAAAAAQGISVCDIDADMAPTFEYFYDDVHFNTGGAQRVFQLLLPCVLTLYEHTASSTHP
jgi:lysophospholipase L1-like esterase